MFLWILFAILVVFGFIGCFISKIPGPLLTYIGILLLRFGIGVKVPWGILVVLAIFVIASMWLSKNIVPKIGAKVAQYGKGGTWGTVIGSLIGFIILLNGSGSTAMLIIALVLSFVVLPFAGAVLGELIARKDFGAALKAGQGAYVVYLCDTVLKLATWIGCLYYAFS